MDKSPLDLEPEDTSPMEQALDQAEEMLSPEVALLAQILMEYDGFDREMNHLIWLHHQYEFQTIGVDRKKKGFFRHVQYLVGVP